MTQQQIAILLKAVDQMSPVLANVNKALGSLHSAGGSAAAGMTGLEQAQLAAGKAAKEHSSLIGGLVDGLGKLGLAGMGVQSLVGAARSLGDALGFGKASAMENVQAQLVAITKDGAAAAKILADIRSEADKTPFAFDEMARATASLVPAAKQANIAYMDLVKQAEVLAASNPEQGLVGAAFSLKEALSGDFTSVIERFNLPRTLINKLKEEGVPAFKAVQQAMLAMGYDASLVAGMAQTSTGKWSTLMDTLNGLRQMLTQPIFERAKRGLSDMQGFLDNNKASVTAWAEAFGAGAGVVIDTLGRVGGVIAGATRLVSEHKEIQAGLIFVLAMVGTAYTLAAAKAAAYYVGITAITGATKAWTLAQAALNLVMSANLITLVVAALAGLVTVVIWAYNNLKPFKEAVDRAWMALREMFTWVGDVADAIGNFLNPAVKAATVGTDAYAQAARRATTGSKEFTESTKTLHQSVNLAAIGMKNFNDDVSRTSRMLPAAEVAALNAAKAFRDVEAANRGMAASIVAANYGNTPFAVGPDDPATLRQEHRDMLGLADGSKYLTSQMGYLTQQMAALNQANDIFGVGSAQSRAIVAAMAPVIDDARQNYGNLTDAQKAVAASAAAAQAAFTAGLPETKAAAAAAKEAEKALKQEAVAIGDVVRALVAKNPMVLMISGRIKAMEQDISNTNLAMAANADQLKAAQGDLSKMSERYGDLNNQLSVAKQRLADLSNPQLVGMGALADQVFAIEQAMKRLKLGQLLGTAPANAGKQLEDLQKKLDVLRLQGELRFDEPLRKLKQAAQGTSRELSFGEALSSIEQTKAQIAGLTGAIAGQEAAMRAQQGVIAAIQENGERLNRVLSDRQTLLADERASLDLTTQTLQTAYTWYLETKSKIEELGPAGILMAQQVDAMTTGVLTTLQGFATGTSVAIRGNVSDALAAYKNDVPLMLAELDKLNTTVVTTHIIRHIIENVPPPPPENQPTSETGQPEVHDYPGPAYAGQRYSIGVPEIFVPNTGGYIVPLGGAGVGGGIDYDKLAAAVAKHPIKVEVDIDGRKVMTATRVAWRSTAESRLAPSGGF